MRRRMHPIAQLIFIVAGVVLIGDLNSIPWSDVARIGFNTGSDHPVAFLGILFTEVRNAFVTATMLVGLGAMVDLLSKGRPNG